MENSPNKANVADNDKMLFVRIRHSNQEEKTVEEVKMRNFFVFFNTNQNILRKIRKIVRGRTTVRP